MMGIKKDTVDCNYFVSTLLAPQEQKQYFDNQKVIIPTQILISDNADLKKLQATADEKIKLLTMYKNIIHEYKLPNKINIYGDYEAMLNEISNSKYLKVKR